MNSLHVVGYFQSYQLTWSYFLSELVAGATLGSLYALFALGGGTLLTPFHIGAFQISWMQVFVILLAAFLMVLLTQLVTRTQIGRAMRATSFDLEAASMMGIDVNRVIVFTFFVGSA